MIVFKVLVFCAIFKESLSADNVSFKLFAQIYRDEIRKFISIPTCWGSLQYAKFKRAECISSGKTCQGAFCKVKLVSRNVSLMSFGCKKGLNRIVNRPLMNFMTLYKSATSQNFRTLINVKNVDVCPILNAMENFPWFEGYLAWFKKTFPGLIRKCPFRDFVVYNASNHVLNSEERRTAHVNPNGMTKGKNSSYPNKYIFHIL